MVLAANGRWMDGAVFALLLAAGFLVHMGWIAKPAGPDASRAVAVLFAPWVDSGTAMQRAGEAGARIVRFGAVPFVIVVDPERSDFAARVKARGAMMIVDPRALAACFGASRA